MTTEGNTKTRRSAWPWVLGAGVVLLVGPPVVLFLAMGTRSSGQVEAERARIRAAGEPASPAELEIYYAHPPADQDVTMLWLAGGAALEKPAFMAAAGALPLVGTGEGEIPLPGQPWPQLEAAERLLAQYQSSLDQLHEAAARGGKAHYPTTFSGGYSMLLNHVAPLRAGARLLALEAHVRAHRGDAAGAAQAIHAGFRLAASLEQEPIVISQLVRIACDAVAREQLRRLLPTAGFSDQDLKLLQGDVRRVCYDTGMQRALVGERVLGCQAFEDPATLMDEEPGALWRIIRGADHARYQQVMGAMIAASRQPFPVGRQEFERIEHDLAADRLSLFNRWQYTLTAMSVPALGTVMDARGRGDAQFAAADAAIAVELFRRREGQLPQRLEQLVPDFMPQLLLDPYDGLPLRYLPGERGYAIYSVGADLQDSGGMDDGKGTGKPDMVFRVELPAGEEKVDGEAE